jgi:hypothetical protein
MSTQFNDHFFNGEGAGEPNFDEPEHGDIVCPNCLTLHGGDCGPEAVCHVPFPGGKRTESAND